MRRPDAMAMAARTAAWAAWLGGWLLLGALGHRSGAPGLGSVLPMVLWLATTAVLGVMLSPFGQGRWLPNRAVAAAGLAGGATAAWALSAALRGADGVAPAASLIALGVGWAVLTLAASQAVRAQRSGRRTPATHVLAAALLGAALAVAAVQRLSIGLGPLGSTGAAAWSPSMVAALPLAVAIVAAMALYLAPGEGSSACARGLLDHLWPPRAGSPSGGVPAPLAAIAATAMLPMMAAWPALADACTAAGWPAVWVAPLHVAAMLLPAAVAVALPRGLATAACAGLLLGGGVAAVTLPGVAALASACALQAAAWGVAWGAALKAVPAACAGAAAAGAARAAGSAGAAGTHRRSAALPPGPPASASGWQRTGQWLGSLAVPATVPATVGATGLAWAHAGPAALQVLHVALAAAVLVWGLAALIARPARSSRRGASAEQRQGHAAS